MGKGSRRRPSGISREREDLNWALAFGKISFEAWKRRKKRLDAREKDNQKKWRYT